MQELQAFSAAFPAFFTISGLSPAFRDDGLRSPDQRAVDLFI
jgi:hypothetical protein